MSTHLSGNNGNCFSANRWSWRAINHAIHLAVFGLPEPGSYFDREGLESPEECDLLADKLNSWLESYDKDVLFVECDWLSVDEKTGAFVEPGTPDSCSPYSVDRKQLQEFIDFLRNCHGFQIW